MSQAPQPGAAGRADAKGRADAAPGTDAAPLSLSPRHPAGGTPKRGALTVAALAGLAVTALPWLPLAATGALAAELKTDDSVCTNWSPTAPTQLYYATRDEQAVNANTFDCQASFAARGAEVPVIDLGTPNNEGSRHLGSNAAGTGQIVRWFSRLAQHQAPSA